MIQKIWSKITTVGSLESWPQFIRSRWWWWLPVVGVLAFGVNFLLLKADSETASRALSRGLVAAGCVAFGWALGIWASVQPDRKTAFVLDEEPESSSKDRLYVWILSLIMILLIFMPDIRRVVSDGKPLVVGLTGALVKLMTIVAVCIPVWLTIRGKKE